MAIPDHPWVDSANGAAVRIAMTVLAVGAGEGVLQTVTDERVGEHGEAAVTLLAQTGVIHADLKVGSNVAGAKQLRAMDGLANRGVIPHGAGMTVTPEQARALGLGVVPEIENYLRPYRNGRDLTDKPRGVLVIDCYGLNAEQVRDRFPALYQWLLERVKPERDLNPRPRRREMWWRFAEDQPRMRASIKSLPRYIATGQVAKHRVFQFLDASILPDDKLIAIALDDSYSLGILSSQVHIDWALALGGRLGVGNDPVYSKSRCFDTFPFPDDDTGLTDALRTRIAQLAEQIDTHRKRVLGLLPDTAAPPKDVTLTGLYNVLQALREGRPLSAKEKTIHTHGLVGVLRELHDELDAAVRSAYGLAADASTDDTLTRLVALNAQRAAEEATGRVRWLRPAFQHPAVPQKDALTLENKELPAQLNKGIEVDFALKPGVAAAAQPWPATLPEQVHAVAAVLAASAAPLPVSALEARFKGRGPWKKGLPLILETLAALGRARCDAPGWRAA